MRDRRRIKMIIKKVNNNHNHREIIMNSLLVSDQLLNRMNRINRIRKRNRIWQRMML